MTPDQVIVRAQISAAMTFLGNLTLMITQNKTAESDFFSMENRLQYKLLPIRKLVYKNEHLNMAYIKSHL